jgi:hypothetical protein
MKSYPFPRLALKAQTPPDLIHSFQGGGNPYLTMQGLARGMLQ